MFIEDKENNVSAAVRFHHGPFVLRGKWEPVAGRTELKRYLAAEAFRATHKVSRGTLCQVTIKLPAGDIEIETQVVCVPPDQFSRNYGRDKSLEKALGEVIKAMADLEMHALTKCIVLGIIEAYDKKHRVKFGKTASEKTRKALDKALA